MCNSLILLVSLSAFAASENVAHTHVEFRLVVNLPYQKAFPLFGAWNEQKWAADWKPRFLYPLPAADREGAVFTIDHPDGQRAVWMTTRFDQTAGRIEHIYVLGDRLITRIGLEVKTDGESRTAVTVRYERTALRVETNAQVRQMSQHDENAAREWQAALDAYAKKIQ
jgi:hypothetical protein